ncbi:hypothetical protein MCOR27_006225 [Pyricularia oryzae]|uniref:Alpha/beta hydrolase fold-3 domain-containing protein n=4 Tax=Pyricularia TaxID=48558 RepID=A0ABQ8NFC6_PYRGI|nr:alpha/beta hydrolase fold protein [Pyricularia oryzae Y34]KAH8847148.1 hypothetical protein MCOR01_000590 [Pyricularia oryzae]KAI6296148.1 hypothetical protein MCOR33_007181 [Pyricularia grisea]KAH9428682.1 hypothetical protein MCOR02_011228 [Pyricularia oryzae]KAI6255804.1 hypothetical protein MCOR19_007708 [Pyricularia oryzae]
MSATTRTKAAGGPTSASATPGHFQPRLPLVKRMLCWLQAAIFTGLMGALKTLKPVVDKIFPQSFHPTLIKNYKSRPGLPIRVFFPKGYDHKNPQGNPLPCLFSIHGGGFVVGIPDLNDDWNHHFCNTHSAIVIALNYRKAPRHPFPTPIHDVTALITTVLDDHKDLARHIDPNRVAVAGFSAGGSLTLAVAQQPQIRSRIQAIVPVYPACDFATPTDVKVRLRRYKEGLKGFRARKSDFLVYMMACFNWSYIPVGHDLTDPLLSGEVLPASALPKRVFIIAAEMDLLAHGAWRLACRLAGKPVPGYDQEVGRPELQPPHRLNLDDEAYHWLQKTKDGREVRWLLAPDAVHAFDMEAKLLAPFDKVMKADCRAKRDEEIEIIGKWLWG